MEPGSIQDVVSVYLAEVDKVPPMSRAEELECIRQVRACGDRAEGAGKRLLESHLPLVVAIAKQHKSGTTLHVLDLIQKGNIGLLGAVPALRTTDQDDFTSLATAHVQRAIADAIAAA